MTLTGVKDVDLLILSYLTNYEIGQLSQTNRYFYMLCNDENFWRNRFIQNFMSLDHSIILKNCIEVCNWKELCYFMPKLDYRIKDALNIINQGFPNMYMDNPHAVNNLKITPLISLIDCQKIHFIKYALINGADPNQPKMWTKGYPTNGKYYQFPEDLQDSEEGFELYTYPLECALRNGNISIVNLLVEYGASWDLIRLDQTLFWVIISYDQHVDCAKLLIEKGANPYSIRTGEPLINIAKEQWSEENFNTVFNI